MPQRPPAPLALTCGEPAGIGPEIAAAAWAELRGAVPFAYLGDPHHLPKGTPWRAIEAIGEASKVCAGALPVLLHRFPGQTRPGRPDPADAPHVVEMIAHAVSLAQSGAAGGVVTCPIHKKVLQDGAGFAYPGHTEYLAHLGGVERVVMMLAGPALRVVPVTIHIALKDVPGALTAELLEETILITRDGLIRDFGIPAPRLAVAGLNPHAGEGGAMGREEIELIAPTLERLRAQGLEIAGPLSADTMFHAAARARYDAAICMYHDQALIPIKTLDFDRGVNVTLGLPFIRTSPDHGTAFDIAGTGKANPQSLIEALRMAQVMARARADG
jgi:4-hydroxythreonine-4-phosphate dehydrogenase